MLNYISHFLTLFRDSRLKQGLTQQGLAKRTGLPQGYISRIEAGDVDLKLSTFVALARALELEVMLVHRRTVTVVQGLIAAQGSGAQSPSTPAYTLGEDELV